MATINFKKVDAHYEADVEVTSDFNLHIERELGGYFYLQVRTSPSGKFGPVKGFNATNLDSVIDFDFTALVYPKTIRIVSEVQPSLGEITFV